MTDRIKALTVVLEKDMREDDAEGLIRVIEMLRGVLSVKAHVSDPSHFAATETARRELIRSLWEVLKP